MKAPNALQSTQRLLESYKSMSGSQKIQIAMQLSELVRKFRQAGAIASKGKHIKWNPASKNFS